MKLREPTILPCLKTLQVQYHSDFHQHALTLDLSVEFLLKCKSHGITPMFIRYMMARFRRFHQNSVRNAVRHLERCLLDAAIAEQRRTRSHCIRNIVRLKTIIRQRVNVECWRRLISYHRTTCDRLRRATQQKLDQKFNRLVHSTTPSFIIPNSVPPDRCTIIDSDFVDDDVKALLNLGPNFCPRPKFSETVKKDIITAPMLEGSNSDPRYRLFKKLLRREMPFPRNHISTPQHNPQFNSRVVALKQDLLRIYNEHRRRQVPDNMTSMERAGLRKAIDLKRSLRFSVGDKCGGFVVMSQERDISLCEAVLSDTTTYSTVTADHYKRECKKLEE
ncbi:hypothetical protein OSTOST_16607, partial [Ostertagia ostertagi]